VIGIEPFSHQTRTPSNTIQYGNALLPSFIWQKRMWSLIYIVKLLFLGGGIGSTHVSHNEVYRADEIK